MNSISLAGAGLDVGRLAGPNFSVAARGAKAEPATTPSWSDLRQNLSKEPGSGEDLGKRRCPMASELARTASKSLTPDWSLKAASTARKECVWYSGAING